MSKCDLSIGSGGVNLTERSLMSIPSILINTANNQNSTISYATAVGASIQVQRIEEAIDIIHEIYKDPNILLAYQVDDIKISDVIEPEPLP